MLDTRRRLYLVRWTTVAYWCSSAARRTSSLAGSTRGNQAMTPLARSRHRCCCCRSRRMPSRSTSIWAPPAGRRHRAAGSDHRAGHRAVAGAQPARHAHRLHPYRHRAVAAAQRARHPGHAAQHRANCNGRRLVSYINELRRKHFGDGLEIAVASVPAAAYLWVQEEPTMPFVQKQKCEDQTVWFATELETGIWLTYSDLANRLPPPEHKLSKKERKAKKRWMKRLH